MPLNNYQTESLMSAADAQVGFLAKPFSIPEPAFTRNLKFPTPTEWPTWASAADVGVPPH